MTSNTGLSTISKELLGMKVALCITGSVAAMESPRIARELIRHGAEVVPVLSKSARRLMKTDLLTWATGNEAVSHITSKMEHIHLASGGKTGSDVILIAPCTANTLSKISSGISDTTVTAIAAVALGSGTPVVLAPGMHEQMYFNPLIESNQSRLQSIGVEIIEPRIIDGKAKLASAERIVSHLISLRRTKDMTGMNVLVTAGPTLSRLDTVRTISNRSSGKMGVAVAQEARYRGALVNLVYGPGTAKVPHGISVTRIETTEEMFSYVEKELSNGKVDLLVAAAAPSDYVVANPSKEKIFSRGTKSLKIELVRAPKIIKLAKKSKGTHLVAFKASDSKSKKLQGELETIFAESAPTLVVLNEISSTKSGFSSDYNEVTIYQNPRKGFAIPRAPKAEIAKIILDHYMHVGRISAKKVRPR